MITHLIYKNHAKKIWQKKYLWVVYSQEDGIYSSGWTWTQNGALNEVELYLDKIDDGRYFK